MRGELSAALASVNHLLQLKYYSHEVAALRSRIAEEMGHTHAVRRITRHTTQSRHTRQRLVGEGQGALWRKHRIPYLPGLPRGGDLADTGQGLLHWLFSG